MSTSTITPGDEKQEEKLNPGQQDYDRRFNDIASREEAGTFDDIANNYDKTADPSQEDANIRKVQDRENVTPENAGWSNNVTEGGANRGKRQFKVWFKKASPLLGMGGIVGVGGFAMVALTSPSLLIVQMKEVMTEKFNTQLSSMDTRSNRLLSTKVSGATSGLCSSTLSVRCRYSTMSDKQVSRLRAAGIEVESKGNTITGRVKPSSFKFKDRVIQPNEFASLANSDPEFRNALKQAYNPKYAGFAGRAWDRVASRFKISKQAPELDAAEGEDAAKAKLNDIASEGADDDVGASRLAPDEACEGDDCVSTEEADAANSKAGTLEEAGRSGDAADGVRSQLSGLDMQKATALVKITGAVDYACQAYGAMTMLSYAAKAIRAAQLVRYTMVFFAVADSIKAGVSPDPEDVSFLGSTLTTTVQDPADETKTAIGSATDSYGYKYAAYGDPSVSAQSMSIASRFTSGASFAGELAGFTSVVLGALGGSRSSATSTCKFLGNPLVQGVSMILGVAMMFVPGANVGVEVLKAAGGAAMGAAITLLPIMVADIVAGTVTKDIVGEESGNAITSGAGALMSDGLAAQNGNAPMTKQDAIAYNYQQTETLDRYIADELQQTSPFDATNPHTFVGSIVSNLLPLQSSSNPLTFVGSLFSRSFANIIPKSNAVSQANFEESLNVCQDPDVLDSGYATDPFCNIIRGIPPQYVNKDPLVVVDELLNTTGKYSEPQITEEGTPQGEFATFISDCITVSEPLGYGNASTGFEEDQARKCIINDDNANYYLFYMDQMIDSGFSGDYGEMEEVAAPSGSTPLPSGSVVELARRIIASGNVTDRTGQLQRIADGGVVDVKPEILQVVAVLSSSNKFTISSLRRDQALSVGAGNASLHLQGRAVDISGSAGVNGVTFGYNGVDPAIKSFIIRAGSIMGSNCDIGVPNQAYVSQIKPTTACHVFVDRGTAPHIHLDMKGAG